MSIIFLTSLVFVFGGVGGFVNRLLAGATRFWPGHDEENVWHPGWVGSIILGAVAAVVIWGIYGSSASYDLVEGAVNSTPHLTLAQLVISIPVGMSGTRILTLEAQKVILRSQRDAAEAAKKKTVRVAKKILEDMKEN